MAPSTRSILFVGKFFSTYVSIHAQFAHSSQGLGGRGGSLGMFDYIRRKYRKIVGNLPLDLEEFFIFGDCVGFLISQPLRITSQL